MALKDGFYGNGEVKNKEEIKTISAASLSFRELFGGWNARFFNIFLNFNNFEELPI